MMEALKLQQQEVKAQQVRGRMPARALARRVDSTRQDALARERARIEQVREHAWPGGNPQVSAASTFSHVHRSTGARTGGVPGEGARALQRTGTGCFSHTVATAAASGGRGCPAPGPATQRLSPCMLQSRVLTTVVPCSVRRRRAAPRRKRRPGVAVKRRAHASSASTKRLCVSNAKRRHVIDSGPRVMLMGGGRCGRHKATACLPTLRTRPRPSGSRTAEPGRGGTTRAPAAPRDARCSRAHAAACTTSARRATKSTTRSEEVLVYSTRARARSDPIDRY
jgi:hypothetical protein